MGKVMNRIFVLLGLLGAFSGGAQGSALTLTSQDLFLYIGPDAPIYYNQFSPEHTNELDSDNFGFYSWQIENTTASTWVDLRVLFFWDGAWQEDEQDLVSNEYAEFLGLGLPVGAPLGAIAPSDWEIDEPEYVFGDIYSNASVFGELDNTNAVPSTAPDDVSLAYRWTIASLAPGESFRVTVQHLTAATLGIAHFDPGWATEVYVNAYMEVQTNPEPPVGPEVPEPSTMAMVAIGFAGIAVAMRRRK